MSIATDNLRVVVLEHGNNTCEFGGFKMMCAPMPSLHTKRVTQVITQWKIIMSTVILRFWQTMVAS